MKFLPENLLENVRGDIYGGLTAAVVALPLALAFGVASGAGAIAGVYGAIFVGFFAALFGGTRSQVSGPTGPMTVVMAAIITQYAHEPALAFTVVIMGGALQILFGVFKLGRYITFVPYTVISGFMSGIGCIIIILEIAPLFGFPSSTGGVLAALAAMPEQVLAALGDVVRIARTPHTEALLLGLITLAIVIFMPRPWRRWAPPPLAGLVVVTVLAVVIGLKAPILGEIPRGLPTPQLPTLSLDALPAMLGSAVILALLGSIDSLLTSLIADNVTRTRHKSDRELIGQGIGNIVAGLFGGLPGAGATMRTVVNVRSGGKTPLSGMLHAVVLLALMLGLAPLAEVIPHAVLAGILLKVGWDIIDWGYLRRAGRGPATGTLSMLTVLLLTVLTDLVTAVGVGIIMVSMISARRLSEHQLAELHLIASETEDLERISEDERALIRGSDGKVLLMRLSGPFSFCSANGLAGRLSELDAAYPVIVFDFSDVPMIDVSIAMAVEQLILSAQESGSLVIVSGPAHYTTTFLSKLGILDHVAPENRHQTRLAALEQAAALAAAA